MAFLRCRSRSLAHTHTLSLSRSLSRALSLTHTKSATLTRCREQPRAQISREISRSVPTRAGCQVCCFFMPPPPAIAFPEIKRERSRFWRQRGPDARFAVRSFLFSFFFSIPLSFLASSCRRPFRPNLCRFCVRVRGWVFVRVRLPTCDARACSWVFHRGGNPQAPGGERGVRKKRRSARVMVAGSA